MKRSNIAPDSNTRSLFDDRYEILSVVGHGRNCVVYKARVLKKRDGTKPEPSQEIVALKVFTGHTNEPQTNIKRVEREAAALMACRHENIIRLDDYVATEELCYLVTEFCDQGDLLHKLERTTHPLHYEVVLELTRQLLLGLQAIHEAGIFHRDIKPENLLLNSQGQVKIADFGVAVLPTEEVTYTRESQRGVGTFDYLSPEYLDAGICGTPSDTYSVGVTAYQLITKNIPFEGSTLTEQINNKMAGRVIPLENFLDDAPVENLQAFIEKALATEPEDRFTTAADFVEGIDQFLAGSWEPDVVQSSVQHHNIDAEELEEVDIFDVGPDYAPLDDVSEPAPELERRAPVPLDFAERSSIFDKARGFLGRIARVLTPSLHPSRSLLVVGALAIFIALGTMRFGDLRRTVANSAMIGGTHNALDQLQTLSGAHTGVFYNLFAEESQVLFTLERSADKPETRITLALPGWSPQEVENQSWNMDNPVLLSGNGIQISLWLDGSNRIPESKISGQYLEHGSGKTGRWVLW